MQAGSEWSIERLQKFLSIQTREEEGCGDPRGDIPGVKIRGGKTWQVGGEGEPPRWGLLAKEVAQIGNK